jgi:hypothetical protein
VHVLAWLLTLYAKQSQLKSQGRMPRTGKPARGHISAMAQVTAWWTLTRNLKPFVTILLHNDLVLRTGKRVIIIMRRIIILHNKAQRVHSKKDTCACVHFRHGAGNHAARGAPPPAQQRCVGAGQRQERERLSQRRLCRGRLGCRPRRAQRRAVCRRRSLCPVV